jgi:hypothetical protein
MPDHPRYVSKAPLVEVLAELREYADAGQAVSRAACGRIVVELDKLQEAGSSTDPIALAGAYDALAQSLGEEQ